MLQDFKVCPTILRFCEVIRLNEFGTWEPSDVAFKST